ncbi:MAG: ankyrin repeat domain-containing protein [Gallionella sp.]
MNVKAKFGEIALLFIVIVLSIAANLSDRYGVDSVISQKILLVLLTGIIFIALFHYLRLMLFVVVIILAIGANLPNEISTTLSISPFVMLVSLAMLIAITATSYTLKLLPTGIEQRKVNTEESRKSVLAAVAKGDLVNLHRLLKINAEINFTQDGTMPVFIAAEKGYTDVMQILVHHGVEFSVHNAAGEAPMDIALAKGYTRIAEILFHASEQLKGK